jgi:hypothetical protein
MECVLGEMDVGLNLTELLLPNCVTLGKLLNLFELISLLFCSDVWIKDKLSKVSNK